MTLIILTAMLTLLARAGDFQSFELRIQGSMVKVLSSSSSHLTLSQDCFKLKKYEPACIATRAIQSLKESPQNWMWPETASSGQNPGAALCTDLLKGEIVLGFDESGSSRTFCRFKDQSLVGTGSLYFHYLNQKRQKVEASRKLASEVPTPKKQ